MIKLQNKYDNDTMYNGTGLTVVSQTKSIYKYIYIYTRVGKNVRSPHMKCLSHICENWCTAKLHMLFGRLHATVRTCHSVYFPWRHWSPKWQPNSLPWRWIKLTAALPFNTWWKTSHVPKPLMSTWLRLSGRLLHHTPWPNSSRQNLEEEEIARIQNGPHPERSATMINQEKVDSQQSVT